MHRLAALDEPVALASLLPRDDLTDVVASFADLHGVGVRVQSACGAVLASAGPEPGASAARAELSYSGEILGEIVVGRAPAEGGERLASHVSRVVGALVHAAYARHLSAAVHVAAIEDAFTELADRNTRLAAAALRLEDLDRLKAQFLATISHELRTPLTSVIGYAEMLLEGLAGDLSGEQRDYVDTILGKADHLLQLITGILDVSLLESKSMVLARKPVSLVEVVDSVAGTLSSEARRRGIALSLPREPAPRAVGDARTLRQVTLQLLANAIKFTPDGGQVTVEVAPGPLSPEDRSTFGSPFWQGSELSQRFGVRLSVTDTGIGIPVEKQALIFEPFFQIDQSSTRAYGGTGLGLNLAKSYVEAHGGFIWVESRPGSGSTFTVSLPAVADDLAALAREAAPEPA